MAIENKPGNPTCMNGFDVYPSKTYHNRYEVVFYGRKAFKKKDWVKEKFAEDDMIFISSDEWNGDYFDMLLTEEQVLLLAMKDFDDSL